MIVVADTSPLIVLVNIGQSELLPRLFGQILIPPAVETELSSASRTREVRQFCASRPGWLITKAPTSVQSIPELHPGESEAISLALELHADLLVVDDRRAYREAISRSLNAVGTIGLLERAAAQGLIDLKDAFERVKQTDFWVSHRLLDERLKLFNQRKP